MPTGNPSLIREIAERIRQSEPITFEQFMDAALYHPLYGYYTSGRLRIGTEGDFYTSSDVHQAFGSCIMRQIDEMSGILNAAETRVVEAGAGKGLLSVDIIASAKEKRPELFEKLHYVIVEKSPDFRERQERLISERGFGDKVSWASGLKEAIPEGVGVILSNELIDAFPVHKVRFLEGRWREIYVGLQNDELVEVMGELSSPELTAFLSSLIPHPSDGYTTEVNLKAVNWIKEAGSCLKKGFVITIDYGYPRAEYYAPERNRGTLMCYHRHQANEDPFINIGEQDITSHVDFTSLAAAGNKTGLGVSGFTEQCYFLMGCGIEEEFRQVDEPGPGGMEALRNNMTIKKLLIPGGMGSIFKVLIQHKGIDRPRLRGFGFKDMARYL